jgi:mannose-6-phosphate isomerase-like protein (cupin superfamily)
VEAVNVRQKFGQFSEHWTPKIVGELNDNYILLAKIKGEFVWHKHDDEDEMFFIVKGRLVIKFRDGEVTLNEGDFYVVPKGVEHLPVADEEVHVMLIEPSKTRHTGETVTDRTVTQYARL